MSTPLPMPPFLWVFKARVERVIDGDTCQLELDVGLHGRRVERVRLLRVDTPETRGVIDRGPGLAAMAFTSEWLARAASADPYRVFPLVVLTVKTDSFGRYLAEVWRDVDEQNLSDALLAAGHAVPA